LRGRSIWNRPSLKKSDVYNLLLDLGGEARWKDLKANLGKLGWGPTTLKEVLDELIEEGSVTKEARLGAKGPEMWYKAVARGADLLEAMLDAKRRGEESKAKRLRQDLDKKAYELISKDDDTEWRMFAKKELRTTLDLNDEVYRLNFLDFAWDLVEVRKRHGKGVAMKIFDYEFDRVFKREIKEEIESLLIIPRGLTADDVDSILKDVIEDYMRERYGRYLQKAE
jgi:DNA-binding HxlR family transcriptional regulator